MRRLRDWNMDVTFREQRCDNPTASHRSGHGLRFPLRVGYRADWRDRFRYSCNDSARGQRLRMAHRKVTRKKHGRHPDDHRNRSILWTRPDARHRDTRPRHPMHPATTSGTPPRHNGAGATVTHGSGTICQEIRKSPLAGGGAGLSRALRSEAPPARETPGTARRAPRR